MDLSHYFQDHWREIEPERLERYELIFTWRPEQEVLIAPARVGEGQTVLDFGAGPGHLAVELARRVGASGHVHGVDINRDFVERSRARAEAAGLADRLHFHHVAGETLPFEDGAMDRILCKNVLEYVPDLDATLGELHRVQRPGGLLHAIDSDWGFVVVEPWAPEVVVEFFAAAAHAFREPNIGRKLPAALQRAGYGDVEVAVQPIVDQTGLTRAVLENMASYIRQFGTLSSERLDALMGDVARAADAGEYFFVLPQFLVTGRA
ncbi:MAG: methyltransferase domain-containing protein [Myxococcota bacterium]|nr:methyltransferase domain-containing protein [Myxococcota bacterium]